MLLTILENWMTNYGWAILLCAFVFFIFAAFFTDILAKRSLKQIEKKKQAEREARMQKHFAYDLAHDPNWYGEHSSRTVKDCLPPKIEGEPNNID